MQSNTTLFLVLISLKHFLADFPLQNLYMLGKGKPGTAWILPLTAHCSVHAAFTLLILLAFKPTMWWLAGIEFITHFVIDRMKATYRLPQGIWPIELKGKYLSKYYFAFGLDQLAHQLTYVLMFYCLTS